MSYTTFSTSNSLDADFGSTYTLPISMVCWIKVPAATWDITSGKYIMHFNDEAFGTGSTSNSIWTNITPGVANRVNCQTQGPSAGNTSPYTHDGISFDNRWVPFVGVHGATTDGAQSYLEDSSNAGTFGGADRFVVEAYRYLRIGANTHAGFNEADDGVLIAEVALFNKLLTTSEVDALSTSSQTGPAPWTVAPSNCLAYWSLNSDQSTHAIEYGSESGFTLDERGTVEYATDHPTIVSGTGHIVYPPTGPWR